MALDVTAKAPRSLDARNYAAAFGRDALAFKQIDLGIREPCPFALRGCRKMRAQCAVGGAAEWTAFRATYKSTGICGNGRYTR